MKRVMKGARARIRKVLKKSPVTRNIMWGNTIYHNYRRGNPIKRKDFLVKNRKKFWIQPLQDSKVIQFAKFIEKIDIAPCDNDTFFYSVDCYKTMEVKYRIFDNYSVDYLILIKDSLKNIKDILYKTDSEFARNEIVVIDALEGYLKRCRKDRKIFGEYQRQLDAISTLFERPAESFFEALQRILFINQFLWQTGHKLNGLGRLDRILIELYRKDIEIGSITENDADRMIKDFFRVLHENYWFKSSGLLGDTGQIIILGGLDSDGSYCCNELTYKFIHISALLKLPDPKILLRYSSVMPEGLLEEALACIATGIGAPLLSNDDTVIPALIDYGYDREAAYDYVTSACWEPLIGESCEQNNIGSINFAEPFLEMLNHAELDGLNSLDDMIDCYEGYLRAYLGKLLSELSKIQFEEEPLISLLSPTVIYNGKDIVRGGAKYNNMGLTSVGIGCVVNSLLNIERLVYRSKEYTLSELNVIRSENFCNHQELVKKLKNLSPCYGSDADDVVKMTKKIECMVSGEMEAYSTYLGGKFKFGLSSPSYITGAYEIEATLDGRRKGEPFGVHISAAKPLSPTELLSFAMKLDYTGNRLNGNVVDFIAAPSVLRDNIKKYAGMLRASFRGGVYQLQMNVVDSGTLIAAKANPERFPELIVRVWGFSAYFNDLPEEYKNVLIARAIESEKAA